MMTDPFAHGTPAGDFHTWIKPEAEPCPDCPCCSARLCEAGRQNALGCALLCDGNDWSTVRDCPCSAATTEGTAAHRIRRLAQATTEEKTDDR